MNQHGPRVLTNADKMEESAGIVLAIMLAVDSLLPEIPSGSLPLSLPLFSPSLLF